MRTENEVIRKWEALKDEFEAEGINVQYLQGSDSFSIEKGNDLYSPPTLDCVESFLVGFKHGVEVKS